MDPFSSHLREVKFKHTAALLDLYFKPVLSRQKLHAVKNKILSIWMILLEPSPPEVPVSVVDAVALVHH